jgi:hypothetical protein
MGVFIPADYDISRIQNATEVRVVEALRDRLKDSWHIIPNLDIAKENRPYEIDVLLLHKDFGLIALEVKGGPVEVRHGDWYQSHGKLDVSPPKQAQNAAYALRNDLRESDEILQHLHIAHGVVLPDVSTGNFAGLIDLQPEQLFLRDDIENPQDKVISLALLSPKQQALNDAQVTAIIERIRPDIKFDWDPQAQARNARVSLDRIVREQTRALASLDQNKIVFVQGSAGTGKTRLAIQWARRALQRGDSTLITCFNIPLGSHISRQFTEGDEIYAGCFAEIVEKLPGLPTPPPMPEDLSQLENYYGLTLPRHILQNIEDVTVRFDTIIVDELQDFHGMWVNVLFSLLANHSNTHLLTVGDENQNLHQREGVQAVTACQPTRAQLMTNCRNAQQIGELLHSLGGAEVASASPDGEIFHIEVNSTEEAVEAVINELVSMRDNEVWDMSRVLVATLGNPVKNSLHAASTNELSLVPWEKADDSNILCETIHRTKGLEYDVVILVAPHQGARERLLYVGASRAISRLVLVSPTEVAIQLGL